MPETADDPLDEQEPPDAPEPTAPQSGHPYAPGGAQTINTMPEWVDKLPDFLARMIRRYGWLIGVRIAISGALFTALGCVAKALFSSMSNSMHISSGNSFPPSTMFGGTTWLNEAGEVVSSPLGSGLSVSGMTLRSMTQPFDIFTGFLIAVGLVLLIGGAALA